MAKQQTRRKQPAKPRPPKQPRQPVTVHYRRLEDVTGAFGKQTLETAIRKAMNQDGGGGKLSAHWKRRAWLAPSYVRVTSALRAASALAKAP